MDWFNVGPGLMCNQSRVQPALPVRGSDQRVSTRRQFGGKRRDSSPLTLHCLAAGQSWDGPNTFKLQQKQLRSSWSKKKSRTADDCTNEWQLRNSELRTTRANKGECTHFIWNEDEKKWNKCSWCREKLWMLLDIFALFSMVLVYNTIIKLFVGTFIPWI